MKSLLIYDLDGTLVDSFPGIASAVHQACAREGITPRVAIDRGLVGPPLDELLRRVAGPVVPSLLTRLRAGFVEIYDGEACRLSEPFPGVEAMLSAAAALGHTLALATNKRLTPTLRILEARGWQAGFVAVEAIDSRPGKARTKAEMLTDLRQDFGAQTQRFCYVGDTDADVEAARQAGMPCIRAAWGYGVVVGVEADHLASTPERVVEILRGPTGN